MRMRRNKHCGTLPESRETRQTLHRESPNGAANSKKALPTNGCAYIIRFAVNKTLTARVTACIESKSGG
jgi:hypothetical protein